MENKLSKNLYKIASAGKVGRGLLKTAGEVIYDNPQGNTAKQEESLAQQNSSFLKSQTKPVTTTAKAVNSPVYNVSGKLPDTSKEAVVNEPALPLKLRCMVPRVQLTDNIGGGTSEA